MLKPMIAGERDPAVLADLARRTLRKKIPELAEALVGRFAEHHAFIVRLHLYQIDACQAMINELSARIDERIRPYQAARHALTTVSGISTIVADIVISETGSDMSVFPAAAQLASWAGMCPRQDQPAGKTKSSHTTHGDS